MCAAPESPRHRRPGTARLGTATAAAGVHAGLWLIATPVAIALTSLEAALGTIVILTALYASSLLSERAFRMLPWTRATVAGQHPGSLAAAPGEQLRQPRGGGPVAHRPEPQPL
jgi:hypothetical protein